MSSKDSFEKDQKERASESYQDVEKAHRCTQEGSKQASRVKIQPKVLVDLEMASCMAPHEI